MEQQNMNLAIRNIDADRRAQRQPPGGAFGMLRLKGRQRRSNAVVHLTRSAVHAAEQRPDRDDETAILQRLDAELARRRVSLDDYGPEDGFYIDLELPDDSIQRQEAKVGAQPAEANDR